MTPMYQSPVLIGVTGKKRHGKGTFGGVARERGFIEINFADHLRELAATINPIVWHPSDYEGLVPWRYNEVIEKYGYEKAKDFFPEVVRFLQLLGSSLRRSDPEYFIKAWANTYIDRSFHTMPFDGTVWKPVVVTDVRYPNEAKAIHKAGGIVVQVIRPFFVFDVEQDLHESEQGIWPEHPDHIITAESAQIVRESARFLLDNMTELQHSITTTAVPAGAAATTQ